MLVGVVFFVINSPILKSRFTEITETALKPPVGIHHNSTNLRVAHWMCAVELVKVNYILGVGLGDTQDKMNDCYKSKNWSAVLYEFGYNCHSQYLQTYLGTGIIGFIALLTILIYPIILAYKIKDYVAISFFVLIFINAITESLFQRQKGILLFTFFASMFLGYYQYKISIEK